MTPDEVYNARTPVMVYQSAQPLVVVIARLHEGNVEYEVLPVIGMQITKHVDGDESEVYYDHDPIILRDNLVNTADLHVPRCDHKWTVCLNNEDDVDYAKFDMKRNLERTSLNPPSHNCQ